MNFITPHQAEAFWLRVDRSAGDADDACWPWLGATPWKGAGVYNLAGKPTGAHRVAYMIAHGVELGRYQRIMQTCRNHACCRPAHLIRSHGGAAPLPDSQRLRSRGFHLRPAALESLKHVCGKSGLSQSAEIDAAIHRRRREVDRGVILPPA